MKKVLFILSLLYSTISDCQIFTVNVAENHFAVDDANDIIVAQLNDIEDQTDLSGYSDVKLILNEKNYNFNSKPSSLTYANSYLIIDIETSNQYILYFTQLPIIQIQSTTTIINEPKTLANFVYADSDQVVVSNIGIEIRGGSSQAYPKKTYDLEFWNDGLGEDTKDVQFGNLRSDDDWILDAMYNEPLRLRSYIANKLWLQLQTPNYITEESDAKAGADVMYIEMFLDGKYNGLYSLSEQVDRKQLKLKKFNDNIRGELYKGISWGASTFTNLPFYDNNINIWSGYELKYPQEEDIIDWSNLYQFTSFVMHTSNTNFSSQIWTKFDIENYSNYFIFLNLLRATDNTGKNIYLTKYNSNDRYFYVPWDLDGCFGTIWNGTNVNITDDILGNGFMNRVSSLNPSDVNTTLSNKWFDYRNNIIQLESLKNAFIGQYTIFDENKIYEREAIVYPNYSFSQEDLSYTTTWIENRLAYLDIYFGNVLSVNENTNSIKSGLIYPNPSSDLIYLTNHTALIDKEFKIYNSLGQLTKIDVLSNNAISIKNLKTGLYFLNIGNSIYKFFRN